MAIHSTYVYLRISGCVTLMWHLWWQGPFPLIYFFSLSDTKAHSFEPKTDMQHIKDSMVSSPHQCSCRFSQPWLQLLGREVYVCIEHVRTFLPIIMPWTIQYNYLHNTYMAVGVIWSLTRGNANSDSWGPTGRGVSFLGSVHREACACVPCPCLPPTCWLDMG